MLLELPSTLVPLVRCLRLTGWRRGEALGLTWDQVDWETEVIRLAPTDTKGGESRVFPCLRHNGQPGTAKRSSLEGRLVHDLRRGAARDLRRAGVSEGVIMKLCGWRTRSMFDRYNVIDEQDVARDVAQRLGKHLANIPAAVEQPEDVD